MKRHRTPQSFREMRRHRGIWEIVDRHTAYGRHSGISGGHAGALYWALSALFTTRGQVECCPRALQFARDCWVREASGFDASKYRGAHEELWAWASDIAQDEAMSAIADSIRNPAKAGGAL